jgi:N-acetylmuramoyl-L-alanine amidase
VEQWLTDAALHGKVIKMKRSNALTTIMFFVVAVLLMATVALGIVTVIRNKTNKGQLAQNTATPTPTASVNVIPTQEIIAKATATPTVIPTTTPSPTPAFSPTPKATVCLDPGHQLTVDMTGEPVGPGADVSVERMRSMGTKNSFDGTMEYEWNMQMADLVKDELRRRGYTVVLTRESNDVNISNKERAEIANDAGADIFVGIQADSYSDDTVYGVYSEIPSGTNIYVGQYAKSSEELAKAIQDAVVAATGAKSRSPQYRDSLAVINWSKMPVCVMQLGYMSNPDEAKNLASEEYQTKIVTAICDGIDAYFAGKN